MNEQTLPTANPLRTAIAVVAASSLTIKEAALATGLSRRTIERALERGRLRFIRLFDTRLIPREELPRLVAAA